MMPQDFTDRGFGIRVAEGYCVVIEKRAGVVGWVEDGTRHPLPLPTEFETIEATHRVAMAFSTYEIAHPNSGLRELLTKSAAKGE